MANGQTNKHSTETHRSLIQAKEEEEEGEEPKPHQYIDEEKPVQKRHEWLQLY